MSNEYDSYDPATECDDDQVHCHDGDRPGASNPDPRYGSAVKDKKEKDKRGFFSRLFSSKGKESGGTPSLMKQFGQKTPSKTSAPKQRSQSAPRMNKSNSWQSEQPVTEQEKQHWKLLQQQAHQPIQRPPDRRSATPDMPQRRGSFDFNPIDDNKITTPNSFYGSSFHQSMDDYHSPSPHDRGLFVNGGAIDNAPQPYYLQSYNQLMHQRQVQQNHHHVPKQHQQYYQQQQHQQQHHHMGSSHQNGQRTSSQQNSGRSTPMDGLMSRSNSYDIQHDPGLEDPAIQAFMEKRRLKKERSREDKLIKEMLVEANLLGISPSKLIPSDASTVLEEKSTTFPNTGVIRQEMVSHHIAPSKRPSQTGPIGDLGTKSGDSYDDTQHIQRSAQSHSKRNNKVSTHMSGNPYSETVDPMKNRSFPLPPGYDKNSVNVVSSEPNIQSSPVTTTSQQEKAKISGTQTTPVSISGSGIVNNTTPTSAAAASEAVPAHPLHDFSGIPKGVNFDPLHVMHVENAEILKIAAALLQKARRHPQLPRTDGIPREVAAAQLATMWLNQATFVRRKAGPTDKHTTQQISLSSNKASVAHVPKIPFPKPEFKQPVTKTEEISSSGVALTKDTQVTSSKVSDPVPAAKARTVSKDVVPSATLTKQATKSNPIPISASSNLEPSYYDSYNHYEEETPHNQIPMVSQQQQMSSSYDYHASSSRRDLSAEMSAGFKVPSQSHYVDSPGSGQRGGRKIMRVPIEEPPGRRQSPIVAPDYARDRAVSEGYLDNNIRPAPMSRQSSANPPPPSLVQQISKRGFQQQQQQQQLPAPPLHIGYSTDPYDHEYDYDASYPLQPQQMPVNYPPPPMNNAINQAHYSHHPPPPVVYDQEYISDLDDEEDSYGEGYEENEYMERDLYGGGNSRIPSGPPPTYSQSFHPTPLQTMSHNLPAPAISGWACKFCTLINDASSSRCSACEAPRTKGPLIV